MDGFFHGKSHLEMDDDWGFPYFRKPPYLGIVIVRERGIPVNQPGFNGMMEFEHCSYVEQDHHVVLIIVSPEPDDQV